MQKIKVNDEVIVIAGKDKGKKGTVKGINFKTNTVLVSGVNVVKKAVKPTQENPNGGFSDVEKGINYSNIALVSPKTGKATRVRIETKAGKKVRIATKCGSELK
jgi:large subunit ribosomal protein L24